MEALTKQQLESALQSVAQGLDTAAKKRKRGLDFYAKLYPDNLSEINLADAARYPELQPLMVAVVEKIIGLISSGKESAIWIDEENQAGSYLSCALALQDKRYCKLFADCLLCQDLYHEVNQNEDIRAIMDKWGLCDDSAYILRAREENPGQHGSELLDEFKELYGDILLDYLGGCNIELSDDDEEEGPDYEIDWGVGYSVRVENPATYDVLFLNWDEDSAIMLVRYHAGEVKVLQYKTPQELQQAVDMLEKSCVEQKLLWTMRTGNASGDLESWSKPEPPCDLLALL